MHSALLRLSTLDGSVETKMSDNPIPRDVAMWLRKHNKAVPASLTKQQRLELKECFNMIDADGGGSLGVQELEDAFQFMGFNISPQHLKDIIEEVDRDGSGEVEYTEFEEIITSALEEIQRRTGGGGHMVSFPVLATAYRRRKLLQAMVGTDEETRELMIDRTSKAISRSHEDENAEGQQSASRLKAKRSKMDLPEPELDSRINWKTRKGDLIDNSGMVWKPTVPVEPAVEFPSIMRTPSPKAHSREASVRKSPGLPEVVSSIKTPKQINSSGSSGSGSTPKESLRRDNQAESDDSMPSNNLSPPLESGGKFIRFRYQFRAIPSTPPLYPEATWPDRARMKLLFDVNTYTGEIGDSTNLLSTDELPAKLSCWRPVPDASLYEKKRLSLDANQVSPQHQEAVKSVRPKPHSKQSPQRQVRILQNQANAKRQGAVPKSLDPITSLMSSQVAVRPMFFARHEQSQRSRTISEVCTSISYAAP